MLSQPSYCSTDTIIFISRPPVSPDLNLEFVQLKLSLCQISGYCFSPGKGVIRSSHLLQCEAPHLLRQNNNCEDQQSLIPLIVILNTKIRKLSCVSPRSPRSCVNVKVCTKLCSRQFDWSLTGRKCVYYRAV